MEPPPAAQSRQRGLGAVDDAEEVDVDHAEELVDVEGLAGLPGDAGVEERRVQPPVLGLDLGDHGLVGRPVGDVEDHEVAVELVGDLPVALTVEVGEDDGDVERPQLGGEGAAEATGPPGDQSDGSGRGCG